MHVEPSENESKTIEIKSIETPSINSKCSKSWRAQQQHQFWSYQSGRNMPLHDYRFKEIPKGTFTYWLSHIESQNRISDKAYFADKYLMKQYITDYKKGYPSFNHIHYAQILWDFKKSGKLTLDQLKDLKQKHNTFLVKPNHTSGKQIIIKSNQTVTRRLYMYIISAQQKWVRTEHRRNIGPTKREPWYKLIQPNIFIEENINIDPVNYPMTEYKLSVFNYKAVFLYIFPPGGRYKNLYTLPEFKWLNVSWARESNKSHKYPAPSKENLDIMIEFSEHFATREKWNYVRVDLYEVNNTIYFSEFTFSPGSGINVITPVSFDFLLYDILCDNNQADYDKIYEYI